MQKLVSKIVSILLLTALLVSPVAAAAPERTMPPTDDFGITAEDQLWLETARAADSFTVQLMEPSLASYKGENALFAMPARSDGGKLDVSTPESVAYLAYLNQKLDAFISDANMLLGRELEVLYRYDVIINGFSARMSVEEAALIRELPEVREVFVDEIYYPDTDTSPGFIGVDKVWDASATPGDVGATGAGTIAGIIDTGINMTHPSFADNTPLGDYQYPVTPPKGLCVNKPDTHFCNNKLIGIYDMLNENAGYDQEGHGSHVAGTVAGNRIEVHYGGATVTISGMAPNAQIISYRVCSSTGCPGNASASAVQQAIIDGVDSLNFSIGPVSGPTRSPWSDATEIGFLEAFEAGIVTGTSSGNSGPNPSTIYKTPPWAIVTGNSGHGRIFGYPVVINPGAEKLESIALFASDTLSPPLAASITGADLIWGGNVNDNADGCKPWPAGSLSGKVGIVQRGECSFADKLQNMITGGALFGLIYNNQSGPPIVMGIADGQPQLALASGMISLEDGLAMEAIATSPMTVNINKNGVSGTKPEWGDIMNDSSSRGPITNFEILQPDLVAPGTNLLAPVETQNGLDLYSGTSMAGPHTAGSALVLRELFPEWSPAAIRTAIIMTAKDGVIRDHDDSPSNPHIEGNGRIDMSKAALVGLIMEETGAGYRAANPGAGGNPQNLNIPSYQNSNCMGGCTFTRTLTNITDMELDYEIIVDPTEHITVKTEPAHGFSLKAGESQEVKVTLTPSILSEGKWQFARITFATDAEFAEGKKVSDSAFSMAAKAAVSGSTLPDELRLDITQGNGSHVIEDVYNADPITAFSSTRYGLTPATVVNFKLAEDPTNGDPYDDRTQVWYTTTVCPAGGQRMVVEILETTAADLDIYVGTGNSPVKRLEKAAATEPGPMEYLNIFQPAFSGTCWIMVQNWEASGEGVEDDIKLAFGFVPKSGGTNYSVSAPAATPALNPFDITIAYNLADFATKEVWYGWFSVGATASATDSVGKVHFNVYKDETPDPEPELEYIYIPITVNP